MKKILSVLLALVMALSLTTLAWATAMSNNYVTIELSYGSNVAAEDVTAAKVLYENQQYATCKEANEAYMALFGVTWVPREGGNPYLDVTNRNAPLNKYAGTSGSVTEVRFYIHGTLDGFTSLLSDGNQIDCTVGGNHQIFRTSYSIIGVNNADGSKAKLTNGDVQAYVAGGYGRGNLFTTSGKLTIDNIEFTNTDITKVGASASVDSNAPDKAVSSAEMEIKNCIFHGRLYVYDNFENQGKMTYNIHDNVFDGSNYSGDDNAYPIFAQCRGGNTLIIKNNRISGFARGINIDHPNINAVIEGNEISITDPGRACIQLSSLASADVTNNKLNLTGGNAITLHKKLLGLSPTPTISITGNIITGTGYFIYDDATANGKVFTQNDLTLTVNGNTITGTVDTTKGIKGTTIVENSGYVAAAVAANVPPTPPVTPVDPTPDPEPAAPAHTNRRYPATTTTTTTETPEKGNDVTSAKTFDAGIALYIGLSALSLSGSAVLMGRKKEF